MHYLSYCTLLHTNHSLLKARQRFPSANGECEGTSFAKFICLLFCGEKLDAIQIQEAPNQIDGYPAALLYLLVPLATFVFPAPKEVARKVAGKCVIGGCR